MQDLSEKLPGAAMFGIVRITSSTVRTISASRMENRFSQLHGALWQKGSIDSPVLTDIAEASAYSVC
jgi:hypothetical protein